MASVSPMIVEVDIKMADRALLSVRLLCAMARIRDLANGTALDCRGMTSADRLAAITGCVERTMARVNWHATGQDE